jgi:chitodextrinase
VSAATAARRTPLALFTLFALVATALVTASAAAPPERDRQAPSTPKNIRVSASTPDSVTLAWDVSLDDVAVTGYYVYGDRGRQIVDTELAKPQYTVRGLRCGEAVQLSIVAFDGAQNRSERATAIVSSAACLDTSAPLPPTGFAQAATSENAVVLTWQPSADNVGVVGYGVYRSVERVASPTDPSVALNGLSCGTSYEYAVDAVDAAGNRSPLARVWVRTSACPSTSPTPPPPPSDAQPPSTPTGLAASNVTQTSASLNWHASTDNVGVTGYDVFRDGVKVASPSGTSANVTGLVCATSYALAVQARDAAGNTSQRAQVNVATAACSTVPPPSDTQPPSTPTGLAASNVTQTSLLLSWNSSTDNVGVAGYDVFRDGVKVASPSGTSANVTGLACATSYALAVHARDAAGNTSQRAQVDVATAACSGPSPPSDTQPPSPPGSLRVSSATGTSVSLAWNASTDNVGVAGYRTYRNGTLVSSGTQTASSVGSLACGSAYTFEVSAFDAAGNSSPRASVIGSTLACPDTDAPSAPANVVASSRTSTSIALTWSAAFDDVSVAGYGLYKAGALVGTSASTTWIYSGLTCGTSYTLAVDAYDAAGNRSPKTTVMVSTTTCPDTTPPSTPTGLAASNVTQTGLTLTWSPSTDNVGVTGYDVYRNGAKAATANFTSSSLTGLTCGTAYSLAVVARDAAGNSSAQASLQVSTAACPPPPSTGTALDDFTDFRNNAFTSTFINRWRAPPAPTYTALGYSGEQWPSGGGLWQVSTPHGPGFRFASTNEMLVYSGASASQMVDIDHLVDTQAYMGTVFDLSGKLMFPAAGNPQGFPAYDSWNVLWEFGPGLPSNNQFGVNGITNRLYVRTYKPGAPNNRQQAESPSPIQYDRWYDFRWQVKFSTGSDGFVNFWLDGAPMAQWTGPTLPTGVDAPWIQWGFYSANTKPRNEVVYAALRKN